MTKNRYVLAQPNQLVIEKCLRSVLANLLGDKELLSKLKVEFQEMHPGRIATLSRAELEKAIGTLTAKTLVYKALQMRSKNAGIKHVKSIQLKDGKDFGKSCHTSFTEPYFYEAAYRHVRDSPSL